MSLTKKNKKVNKNTLIPPKCVTVHFYLNSSGDISGGGAEIPQISDRHVFLIHAQIFLISHTNMHGLGLIYLPFLRN